MTRSLLLLFLLLLSTHSHSQTEPNPILPDTLHVALGNRIEIFNDNVAFVQLGNSTYTFGWEYEVGSTDAIKWYWTSDRLGSFDLVFNCYENGSLVDQASTVLTVSPRASQGTYNVLSIGNSITDGGGIYFQYEQIIKDIDVDLNFIGTRGDQVNHEGHAGWMFRSFLEPGSPFYFNGSVDLARYISDNGLPEPDIVKLSLGPNEAYWLYEVSVIAMRAEELMAEIREDYPDVLILIAMPTLCENTGDGWINSYGTLVKYEPYQQRVRGLWEYLLANYEGSKGHQLTHVSYDGLCVDRNDGYRKDENGVHIDGVHPEYNGLWQLSRGFSNVLNHCLQEEPEPDTEAPSVPSGLASADITQTSFSVSWEASSDNIGVLAYRIFLNGGFSGNSFSTTYDFSGLDPGTDYSVSISAVDEALNESPPSEPLLVTTLEIPDTQAPSIPEGLEFTSLSQSSVHLRWSIASDNVGVAGYRIYLDDVEAGQSSQPSFSITGLTASTDYTVSVAAYDAAMNLSEKSSILSFRTLDEADTEAPTVPGSITLTGISSTEISIEWAPSMDNVGVLAYRIFINGTESDTTDLNHLDVSGLQPGTTYSFSLSAFDASMNESAVSHEILASTLPEDTLAPTVPASLASTLISDTTFVVVWEPSTDNIELAGYRIYVNDLYSGFSSSAYFKMTQLLPGDPYLVKVSAFDASGNESEASGILLVKTTESDYISPDSPGGLVATLVTGTTISLVWEPARDNVRVTEYRIFSNGLYRGSSITNSFSLTQLNPGIVYTIRVTARDEAGNESAPSDSLVITTFTPEQIPEPVLPDLQIYDSEQVNNRALAESKLISYGHTDLQAFGMLVRKDSASMEDAWAINANQSEYNLQNDDRVLPHLQLFYNFSKGSGNRVSDRSGSLSPVHLTIYPHFEVDWLVAQGLQVQENAVLSSEVPAIRIIDSIKTSNEFTLETWIRPSAVDQPGPSAIASLSAGEGHLGLYLGQSSDGESYTYQARIRTTATDSTGYPIFTASKSYLYTELQHVVLTRDSAGNESIYIDGLLAGTYNRPGELSVWDEDYLFELGNMNQGSAPWMGYYYMVALYSNALETSQVQKNYEAGIGSILFQTELKNLAAGSSYHIYPFARTATGISTGNSLTLVIGNGDFPTENDSLNLKIYPNPNRGDFMLYMEDNSYAAEYATIRIADMMGQVLYIRNLALNGSYFSKTEPVNLAGRLPEGFYSVLVTIGSKSAARRLIIKD